MAAGGIADCPVKPSVSRIWEMYHSPPGNAYHTTTGSAQVMSLAEPGCSHSTMMYSTSPTMVVHLAGPGCSIDVLVLLLLGELSFV